MILSTKPNSGIIFERERTLTDSEMHNMLTNVPANNQLNGQCLKLRHRELILF